MRTPRSSLVFPALLALVACGGSQSQTQTHTDRPRSMAGQTQTSANAHNRCDATAAHREVSEYDTSGDDRPDVRKVFLEVGNPPLQRLVLICREADLNGDGTKDIVRYYDDEGRPTREEADRNFDGSMDDSTFFENGRVVREELDGNYDGKIDTKIFYDHGQPARAERDMSGRSTTDRWRADRWEYYESGRMVRMGTDVDGDGTVDRWDRDDSNAPRGPDIASATAEAAVDTGEADPDAGTPSGAVHPGAGADAGGSHG